jgi:hypothetical protein
MTEVGQIKDGQAEKFEQSILCGGLAIGQTDGTGDYLPVRPGKAAIGHRAVDDLKVAFTVLQHDSAGKKERICRGIDRRAAQGADSLGAMHTEVARGVHIQAHLATRCVNCHIAGSARYFQIALRFQL